MEAAPAPADGRGVALQLQQMGERLAGLLEGALEEPEVSADVARKILQEMATALEEFRVAEEELVVQAEQLLASAAAVDAERERYGELFEFAPDAYLETDGLGKILAANGAAERLLGVSSRFLAGKLLHAFLVDDEVRAFRRLIADLQEADGPLTFELQIKPRTGHPVPVELRAAARFYLGGDDTGEIRVRWLLRDITERLKLEAEVAQLHSDVELLQALAEVNRLVAGVEDPMIPMLEGLVELARSAAPGAEAGIMIADARGSVQVRAMSAEEAADVCAAQEEADGPAVLTLRDGESRVVPIGQMADGWPPVADAMRRHGWGWALSCPISVGDGRSAVFNLYGPGEPPADLQRSVELLAANAAGIIANGDLYRSANELASQLSTALESRGIIDQAKGILMAWQGCDAEAAFDILRRASQRENRKLRVMAAEIVERAAKGPGRGGG